MKSSIVDHTVLVGGSIKILTIKNLKKLLRKTPTQSLNSDAIVAVGVAVQSGVLGEEIKDILLLYVPPSLGVETLGGITTKLHQRI